MPIYATTADLTAYTGQTAPANATQLLRSASLLIARAVRGAVYAVLPNGTPTDSNVTAALRDATCAQAATLAALGVDPVKGAAGVKGVLTSSSAEGGSLSWQVPAGQADMLAAASQTLADDAASILAAAGLLSSSVTVIG